jgi:hypothetical protein
MRLPGPGRLILRLDLPALGTPDGPRRLALDGRLAPAATGTTPRAQAKRVPEVSSDANPNRLSHADLRLLGSEKNVFRTGPARHRGQAPARFLISSPLAGAPAAHRSGAGAFEYLSCPSRLSPPGRGGPPIRPWPAYRGAPSEPWPSACCRRERSPSSCQPCLSSLPP